MTTNKELPALSPEDKCDHCKNPGESYAGGYVLCKKHLNQYEECVTCGDLIFASDYNDAGEPYCSSCEDYQNDN